MKRMQYKNGWCLIGLFYMAALLLIRLWSVADAVAQQEEALLQVAQQWAQNLCRQGRCRPVCFDDNRLAAAD